MRKKVLIINNSARISGAETSLLTFLHHCHPEKYAVTLLVPPGAELARMAPHCTIKTWNLRRIQKSGNVLRLLAQLAGVAWSTVRLSFFVRREKVDVIYANSNQSQLYACLLNVLVRRKSIWHVRDNPGHAGLARLFAWGSSCIICISRHVYDQVPASRTVKHLVYNGPGAPAGPFCDDRGRSVREKRPVHRPPEKSDPGPADGAALYPDGIPGKRD